MIHNVWHILVRATRVTYRMILRPEKERIRGFIVKDNQVLLVEHVGGNGKWTLPGGGEKRGETIETALRREIKEELGLEIKVRVELTSYTLHSYGARTTYRCLLAYALGDFEYIDRYELRKAGWFHITDLPDNRSVLIDKCVEVLGSHYLQNNPRPL